ncbi:MAG: hypothetical protein GY785_24060 [Gammaproteobacteria bacterium]|nr:hypothetical protein [Gammaproteobacteria bacterium]
MIPNQGNYRLTEQQEIERDQEIGNCDLVGCGYLISSKYSIISSLQGTAEAAGIASGAVNQIIEDFKALVDTIDDLIENPEKAEQAAEYATSVLIRTEQVLNGDELSDQEKEYFSNGNHDTHSIFGIIRSQG